MLRRHELIEIIYYVRVHNYYYAVLGGNLEFLHIDAGNHFK